MNVTYRPGYDKPLPDYSERLARRIGVTENLVEARCNRCTDSVISTVRIRGQMKYDSLAQTDCSSSRLAGLLDY